MENPFAVPPPLFSRKRKASVASITDGEKTPFLREETYHAYSIDGHVRESTVYQDELARRTVVRDALAMHSTKQAMPKADTPVSHASVSAVTDIQPVATSMHGASVVVAAPPPVRHLTSILLDRAEKERSREMAQVINVTRRLSSIPIADHVEYMRLRQKRMNAQASGMPLVLALSSEEHDRWNRLDTKAKMEQATFVSDLERLAKKERLTEYTFVPPHFDQLYDALVQSCRNQVMHLYPRYYETQMVVRLHGSSLSTAERSTSTMKHVQEVASHGPRVLLNKTMLKQTLSLGDSAINEEVARAFGAAWSAISADPTAEKLMETHACDVAMTSSTLLAIFDTAVDEDASESLGWMIAVKSRICMVQGKPRRQIYLDRPLVNAEVSAREKIRTVAQAVASTALTKEMETQGTRVSYHVWRMGEFKILLRTKTPLFLDDAAAKSGEPVSLFVKPDHLPQGMAETLTDSEFRRMWLHAWIRGGATLVVGRLVPKSSTFTSWTTYHLPKFLQSLGSSGFPDAFEPLDFFVAVHTVLTSLQSLPPATFLLRCDTSLTTKKHGRELHILRSATEIGVDEDHHHQFDLFQHINSCGHTSTEVVGYVLPQWPPVPNRIPYTYRTGTYCRDFLQRGLCEREGSGEACDGVHMRLKFTKKGINWVFDDLSATQAAKRAVKGGRTKYPQWTPTFPFCRGAKGVQAAKLLANLDAPIRCDDPSRCTVPHLSLHEIAEQVADTELRLAREKRRKHKAKNRTRGRDHPLYDDWY